MTPEHEALARRAVACPRWRWMPGMLLIGGHRVDGDDVLSEYRPAYALPDLTDPATLGCLLALVREAWSEPILSVAWAGGRWYVVQRILLSVDALRWIDTATEAEALAATLEAAP
jgi:hypothetical protein